MGKAKFSFLSANSTFVATILLLSVLGLLFVFDVSIAESFNTFGNAYHFLQQHAIRLGIGLVAFITMCLIPLDWLKKLSLPIFIVGLISLVLVFVPGIGRELNGAHRWLFIGGFRFQPIEMFKLGLIIYFASWMSRHQKLLPFLFTTGVPAILLLLQPDLGSLLVLGAVAFIMFFIAGGEMKHILGIAGASVVLLGLLVVGSDYRRERLTTFLNPQADPLGAGFHIRQITLALGRGGWLGQGIGNSRQKYSYIPEASTDSIFAIIAEEIGFIGSSLIIFLFGFFFLVSSKIASKPDDEFAYLLGWGILSWIGVQTILNLAAVVALVPLTGITLPFFSYGGSSLIMVMAAGGILWRIGKEYN